MRDNFEVLVKRLTPTLKRITFKLNGHFSFFDEEDLYQEAVEYLWIISRTNSLEDKTDSYVLQGCYFYLKNYIRKNLDKTKVMSLNDIMEEDGIEPQGMPYYEDKNPFEKMDTEILATIVKKNGLSEREEKVLSLFVGGDTTREVGKKLDISHVMVIKIRKKIRQKTESIRHIFNNKGYQD